MYSCLSKGISDDRWRRGCKRPTVFSGSYGREHQGCQNHRFRSKQNVRGRGLPYVGRLLVSRWTILWPRHTSKKNRQTENEIPTASRSTVAPPNFSLTKSPVLKPAPSPVSWTAVPLFPPTSSFDCPCSKQENLFRLCFLYHSILPRVEQPWSVRWKISLVFWGAIVELLLRGIIAFTTGNPRWGIKIHLETV